MMSSEQQPRVLLIPPLQTTNVAPPMAWQRKLMSQEVMLSYNSANSMALGWSIIVLGFCSMVFAIAGIIIQNKRQDDTNWASYAASGFWCGMFYILAGGLAIGAAQRRTVCVLRSSLGLAVIGAVLGFLQLSFSVAGILIDHYNDEDHGTHHHSEDYGGASMSMNILLMLLAMAEIGLCISSAELVGRVLCQAEVIPGSEPLAVQYSSGTHSLSSSYQDSVPSQPGGLTPPPRPMPGDQNVPIHHLSRSGGQAVLSGANPGAHSVVLLTLPPEARLEHRPLMHIPAATASQAYYVQPGLEASMYQELCRSQPPQYESTQHYNGHTDAPKN